MASTLLLLVIVFILDLIAFGLAVAAAAVASAKVNTDATSRNCTYESDIATGLGVGSMLLLLASQLLLMVVSRCLCCGRALKRGGSRVCAIVLFIMCWATFYIAESSLVAGSVRNAYHTKNRSDVSCETLRKVLFGVGAAFIVFTGILSELYYFSYSKTKMETLAA